VSTLRSVPPSDANVLVIDDDADMLDSLCEALEDAGYRVTRASNGADALTALASGPLPELILLDLMMPVMDGYGFRDAQRRDARLAAIPTVALTAGVIDDRIKAMHLDGWLRKPLQVSALIAAVERHRSRRGDGVPSPVPAHEGHSMQFYASGAELAERVADYLAPAFAATEAVVVVATPDHWQLLEDRLSEAGVDLASARVSGKLAVLDAHRTLASIRAQGRIIETRFREVVGSAIVEAQATFGRVRAYGEMVDLLWQDGDIGTAVALEECWNRLLTTVRCDLHCAYAAPVTAAHRAMAGRVCQQHAQLHAAL
jgi:CheY-like chemotaxis protein